ncbi:MAG: SPW repeat protein [Candidatus Paceibacterota bacterium]
MKWNNWALIILGIWSISSPWILGFSGLNLVVWNIIMIGGLIIIFTLWNHNPEE